MTRRRGRRRRKLLDDVKERRGYSHLKEEALAQCFSTAGPWHQLYRAARGSPGICHFNFLRILHE